MVTLGIELPGCTYHFETDEGENKLKTAKVGFINDKGNP